MNQVASQITDVSIVCSTVCSGVDQRKHQSSASLFFRGIQRWPVDSPHKGPVTRNLFPFNDAIMTTFRQQVGALQWCHINVTREFVQQFAIPNNKWNIKAPNYRPVVMKIHQWPKDFTNLKGPIMRRALPSSWHSREVAIMRSWPSCLYTAWWALMVCCS